MKIKLMPKGMRRHSSFNKLDITEYSIASQDLVIVLDTKTTRMVTLLGGTMTIVPQSVS